MGNDNIFSITAHIDLLGFSNHLILSSNDLRTKIGGEAIQRLRILENATKLVEKEKVEHSDFYPEGFRILRFNDSLILGIDINPPIVPDIGKPNEQATYKYGDLEDFFGPDDEQGKIYQKTEKHFSQEAIKASQFVAIISRIHDYINREEYDIHMPGCRSIISSGLRYRFIKENNEEDFYSANFSLSNAYIVNNELGSKHGFTGNKCYIENNVAIVCGYNNYTKRLISYTKFLRNDLQADPFSGKTNEYLKYKLKYSESKKIEVELFKKKYIFRELNTTIASNLQLFPKIIELIENETNENKSSLAKKLIENLSNDTPSIEEINKNDNPHSLFPIMWIGMSLDDDIQEAIDVLNQNIG